MKNTLALIFTIVMAVPSLAVGKVAPVPPWQIAGPVVPVVAMPASVPELRSLAELSPASAPLIAPVAAPSTVAAVAPGSVTVHAGGSEQLAITAGKLEVASAAIQPPAVPAWLDGWFWPLWRGPTAPVAPEGMIPFVVWPTQAGAMPQGPHFVAIVANATTPMVPLAEFLAADHNAVAVIVGWEMTDHSFRADATLDSLVAAAVAATVRASRPGLPVWLLHSLTVTGSAEQAAANVAVVHPDALVVYGLFAVPAWESDEIVTHNLQSAQAILAGKPIYAAGLRFVGQDKVDAGGRARRLGWGGILCDGSAQ